MIKFCADIVNFLTTTFAFLGFVVVFLGTGYLLYLEGYETYYDLPDGVMTYGMLSLPWMIAGFVVFYITLGLFSLLGGIYQNQKELIYLAKAEKK